MRFPLYLAIVLSILSPMLYAQDIELHGFAQTNYAGRFSSTDDAPPMVAVDKDLILGDERVQLELSHFSESGTSSFSAKIDLMRDAIDGTMQIDTREAYLDLALWKLDTRVGRQIVTWGLGDLVFINDTFPKDWVAFLSGQPLQYLKVASDAVSISLSTEPVSAQLIVTPFFEPDNLPSGERLFYHDPLPPNRELALPQRNFENIELAARIYRSVGGFDGSFYAYQGFSRMPAVGEMAPDGSQASLFYPELRAYGASLQGAFLGGLLSLEGGYYNSADDPDGNDPFIENSQARALVGYQRAVGADLTIGVQYYAEAMMDHDTYANTLPAGFPMRRQVRHNMTLRLTQFFKYQTLRLSLFGWFSPNEEDYFVNPEMRYSFTDELWGAVGANIMGGSENHTFLGQFEQNDNVYLTMRYGF